MNREGIRVQKILAQAGIGSRRACEQMIDAGRVTVNGKRARLGDRANPLVDRIEVDSKALPPPEQLAYFVLNKPRGVMSSTRAYGNERTVLDIVQTTLRVYPVGRLDLDSEGLILLTNDGELANKLTHPRYMHEKEYSVMLDRPLGEPDLAKWAEGVELDGGEKTLPLFITRQPGNATWLRIVMKEGKKRQIRRTADSLGYKVRRLVRTRIATLELGDMKAGEFRTLNKQELVNLKIVCGIATN